MNPVRGLWALIDALRDLAVRRREALVLQRRYPDLRLGIGVEVRSPSRLRLGHRVTIDSGALLHCGGMDWCGGEGGIEIGDGSYVGPHVVLFGAGGISLGKHVLLSPGVVVTSHQHSFGGSGEPISRQPTRFAAVAIEDDVWVGANATILPGVRIGSGAVVGAGAVVTRAVPPRTLSIGAPARNVRTWP